MIVDNIYQPLEYAPNDDISSDNDILDDSIQWTQEKIEEMCNYVEKIFNSKDGEEVGT